MSRESLASFSADYAQLGTAHRRLLAFTRIPDIDLDCGSVMRSFVNGIKSYAKHYNEAVLACFDMNKQRLLTVVDMHARLKHINDQIR